MFESPQPERTSVPAATFGVMFHQVPPADWSLPTANCLMLLYETFASLRSIVVLNVFPAVYGANECGPPTTVDAGTVTVAAPDLVLSSWLVAVTVTVCAELVAAGAVNRPLLLMLPALAVQLTPCEGEFVPVTVAVNCCVAPPETLAVLGLTLTLDTVGVAVPVAGTVTVAVPVFVVSTVLRAVIVIVCAEAMEAGAVNTPPVVIEPALAVQVTVCAGELVPVTVAVKVCVAPPATLGAEGDTVTLVTVTAGAAVPPKIAFRAATVAL